MPRLPPALMPLWPRVKAGYTAVTRRWSPASAALARLTNHGGPRRVALTVEDAVTDPEAVRLLYPAETLHQPHPLGRPPRVPDLAAVESVRVPRTVVATIPDARITARYGTVVTSDGTLVYELSPYFSITTPAEHPAWLKPWLRQPHRVSGAVGVIACRGDFNYCHFLSDCLPRLAALQLVADQMPVDGYYVPLDAPFQRPLLEMCGLGDGIRLIDSRQHPHLQAERLVVPSLPNQDLHYPTWVVDWLRQRLAPSPPPRHDRRIYLTRGRRRNTRIVLNEDEVVAALARRGFESADPGAMSVAEQFELFASAELIVSPHGAALTNLLVAQPGTRVIEIFAPEFVNTCYFELAARVPGLDYRYLLGVGEPGRHAGKGIAADITVDVPALLQMLDAN